MLEESIKNSASCLAQFSILVSLSQSERRHIQFEVYEWQYRRARYENPAKPILLILYLHTEPLQRRCHLRSRRAPHSQPVVGLAISRVDLFHGFIYDTAALLRRSPCTAIVGCAYDSWLGCCSSCRSVARTCKLWRSEGTTRCYIVEAPRVAGCKSCDLHRLSKSILIWRPETLETEKVATTSAAHIFATFTSSSHRRKLELKLNSGEE